jgi:hypothetical protein
MQQPDLFSGDELRDFGIAAAERDRILAIQAVDTAISRLADELRSGTNGWTAETVRADLGRYTRDLEDISKIIGGRIRAAALRGDIYTKGETVKASRPNAHSRRLLVWYSKLGIREVVA